jgi:hypothetical protein
VIMEESACLSLGTGCGIEAGLPIRRLSGGNHRHHAPSFAALICSGESQGIRAGATGFNLSRNLAPLLNETNVWRKATHVRNALTTLMAIGR